MQLSGRESPWRYLQKVFRSLGEAVNGPGKTRKRKGLETLLQIKCESKKTLISVGKRYLGSISIVAIVMGFSQIVLGRQRRRPIKIYSCTRWQRHRTLSSVRRLSVYGPGRLLHKTLMR